jgi:hypothetical protein
MNTVSVITRSVHFPMITIPRHRDCRDHQRRRDRDECSWVTTVPGGGDAINGTADP